MSEKCFNDEENNFIKFKIGNHNWEIRFITNRLMPEGAAGFTYFQRKTIDVDDSLDKENTELVVIHELTHAFLMTHGRGYQLKFSQEEVCEFVAWNIKDIYYLVNYIMAKRYGKIISEGEF